MGNSADADGVWPHPGDGAGPYAAGPSPAAAGALRWRRLFGGQESQLSVMRQWIKTLLPEGPARDDLLTVATELGSNALLHTASGQGGGFAVEITWYHSVVRVAVADRGGPAEPRIIDDPDGERGRGLLLVQGLAVRTGCEGDQRGRLAWAEVSWGDAATPTPASPQVQHEAAISAGEASLARRFAGVPAWYGHATRRWWALADPDQLVSAPTAAELASLLDQLLPGPPHGPVSRHARRGNYPIMSA